MKEKLYFEDSNGCKLCGVLSNPISATDIPITILVHGLGSNKNSQTYLRLEEVLNSSNIASFRFDLYAHGESQGNFAQLTFSRTIDDMLSAIKFIKGLGYSQIGLTGSSFSGIAALITASRTDDLALLALKSPICNYRKMVAVKRPAGYVDSWEQRGYTYWISSDKKRLRLNYSFYEDSEHHNGYEAAKKIRIPTLIVHGNKDDSVPVEQSIKTAKIIKNCHLEIIKGADHNYSNPEHFERMIGLISEFVVNNSTAP